MFKTEKKQTKDCIDKEACGCILIFAYLMGFSISMNKFFTENQVK